MCTMRAFTFDFLNKMSNESESLAYITISTTVVLQQQQQDFDKGCNFFIFWPAFFHLVDESRLSVTQHLGR